MRPNSEFSVGVALDQINPSLTEIERINEELNKDELRAFRFTRNSGYVTFFVFVLIGIGIIFSIARLDIDVADT
jgi:hypothetical protein